MIFHKFSIFMTLYSPVHFPFHQSFSFSHMKNICPEHAPHSRLRRRVKIFFPEKRSTLKSKVMQRNNKLHGSAVALILGLWAFCYLHTTNEKVSTDSQYVNFLIKYGLLTPLHTYVRHVFTHTLC